MIVQGEGNPKSKLWLIGEAPGANEERLGRPFVGGAGMTLDGMLKEAGIERQDIYIDNVIQERPPSNDFSVYYHDKSKYKPKQELINAHARINALVKEYKPNAIGALGNEAVYAFTGHKGIMKWRGSVVGSHGTKVIPIIHPSAIMRMWENRPITVMDLRRLKDQSFTPEFPQVYNDRFTINPSFEKVMETLRLLHSQTHVSFDIETAANQMTCIGFAWSREDAICIPIFYGDASYWTKEEELAITKAVRDLFSNEKINFIAQNAQYDMVYLADKWGVEVKNLWLDTMIAFHCIYPEMKKGLAFLCSIYTYRPYYKESGHGGPNELWHYNCLDTVVTWECAMKIVEELGEFDTMDFYRNHSHKLIKPIIQMQRRGVRIEMDKRKRIDENLEGELVAMQTKLNQSVGHELNPNSPKQMKEFLYTELKLPPQRNRATGALTANEEALELLAKKHPTPIFNLILDIRKVRKLLSTYIRAPIEEDCRMRCAYIIGGSTKDEEGNDVKGGTETGRLSSRKSVYGFGTNLQNIPRGEVVRGIFIPDAGYKFINADLSQAEARVVAYLSEESRLQNLFEDSSGDIHKQNASRIFNKAIAEVSGSERQLAKTLVHAANYGIGARTFAKHIGAGENRARELLNQYYALYPCIKLWHRKIEEELRRTRTLRTPLGRKRVFFGRWGPDLTRQALAYIPQSTVSDLLNMGLVRAWDNLPNRWEILMQVHDSVVMQVPEEAEPIHVYKFIKHYFESPLTIKGKTFKIPVDIKTGMNWGEMEKLNVEVTG